MSAPTTSLIFIHSSDELYGADRMLLEQLAAVPPGVRTQVWLPTDLGHPGLPLCAELTRRGVDVHHLDLPIIRRAYRTPRALASLTLRAARLRRAIRVARPDVVYCTTSAAALAAPIARTAGVPRVVGHIQEIWTRSDRYALVPLLSACHLLVAISAAVAARVPDRLRARVTVVPNCTPEPSEVQPLDGRTGPLTFVVASRWNGWKGHRTLLAAWNQVREGTLVVLGGPPPSGDAVDVRALVRDLDRPASVQVVGDVADPSAYLTRADVVVVPSDRAEPFGLVAIESFARARPVIGSAAGGLLDIITDRADGWLYPPTDSVALGRLMAGLGRVEVRRAGDQARRTYEARFTSDRYATEWRRAVGLASDGDGSGVSRGARRTS